MRTPSLRTPPHMNGIAASTNHQKEEEQSDQLSSGLQIALVKAESDDEHQQEHEPSVAASPARPTVAFPNLLEAESRIKRSWRTGSSQQLLGRTQNRIRCSNMQQPLHSCVTPNEEYIAQRAGFLPQSDFAEEIENEAAEIRTLIARTAQLWSAVDQAEHNEATVPDSPQSIPFQRLGPPQSECTAKEECTVSEDDENEQKSEEGEYSGSESIYITHQSRTSSTHDETFLDTLQDLEHGRIEDETLDVNSGNEDETMGSFEDERTNLQLEQGELINTSNRAINASKSRAIQSVILGNLIRLGFREHVTRTALEAGVLEIDHYDADCELAYVDIFMSLVKLVCDAHVDVLTEQEELGQTNSSAYREDDHVLEANAAYNEDLRSFLPFKWPVFDMAQFEFGNARQGTCFNSVCVLTNLPKVAMDRTEELMEMLSCNLFCMLGDPIQVVIPSTSSSGRTKGHAFLEFDDPDLAKQCALAIDGLTWGKGPFGRIRGNLFRHYQVNSFAEQQRYARDYFLSNSGGPASQSLSKVPPARDDEREIHRNRIAERFRPHREQTDEVAQENLFCDSDDDSSDDGAYTGSQALDSTSLPLLNQSSGCTQQDEQLPPNHVVDWHSEALSNGDESLQISCEGGDDSYASSSALELQALEEDKLMNNSIYQELTYTNSRCTLTCASLSSGEAQAASSTVTSTASAGAREALADCGMIEQSWIVHDDQEGSDKPWRRYCEDLIVRNQEMHKQLVFARRRVVQMSHNNQKLHLLIDRVERDRDGLLYENDVLQTQVHAYADHEQHQDSLMQELLTLRQGLKKSELTYVSRTLDPPQHGQAVARHAHASFHGIHSALSYVSATVLAQCKMDELKDWEDVLETTLSHVRSVKEEKALEMQKKLDRQVEEQNELKLCVICLANDKTILCLPCRHLCLCKACSHRQEVTKCPICRLEIDEMLAVYS